MNIYMYLYIVFKLNWYIGLMGELLNFFVFVDIMYKNVKKCYYIIIE